MTYSDVITLLMTLFILLLTFATNEPEKFEQMQVSRFGGKGSDGIAKASEDALERDSLLIRVRTRARRVTTRGTETPPIHADLELQSINKGLEALDKELEHELESTRSIMLPLPALVDDQNKLTSFGTAIIKKFSRHLGKAPFTVTFSSGSGPPDRQGRGALRSADAGRTDATGAGGRWSALGCGEGCHPGPNRLYEALELR